jgi:hypothetical protein
VLPVSYRFISLPPDFNPVDATVKEVMSYRRESRSTVWHKMRARVYASYRDGDTRKIIFESVKRDREQQIAAGPQFAPDSPLIKRKRGRPRKTVIDPSAPQPAE